MMPTHVRSKGRLYYSLLNFVASGIFFVFDFHFCFPQLVSSKVCFTMGCGLWGVVWKVDRRDSTICMGDAPFDYLIRITQC